MSMDAKMPRIETTRQPRSGKAWRVLAIDTCFARCAIALAEQVSDSIVGVASIGQEMTRGHAAILAPMIEQGLSQAGWRTSELDLITLTIGPGSFTGVRIGLAMARGLAMTLRCPIAGITTTDALLLGVDSIDRKHITVAIESGRGDYFLAMGDDPAPFVGTAYSLTARLVDRSFCIIGDGAPRLTDELRRLGARAEIGSSAVFIDVGLLAAHALTLGVAHWTDVNARDGLPRPLYLRGADVTLSTGMRTTADIEY